MSPFYVVLTGLVDVLSLIFTGFTPCAVVCRPVGAFGHTKVCPYTLHTGALTLTLFEEKMGNKKMIHDSRFYVQKSRKILILAV